ncbi:autotransporter assembly complex protein TamA [Candidatus Sulfurimonas baltica]|uniref:BamA/TamA family outer membrane protein n=1 Tax=Candidatus Sulfurimonas baltica TaxID=2740404 RepID=A0A7S7RMW7_9BACT|nr:outer membrane protein assembly factor [Candidatus Sulfurimonas baltica]QOY51810.1 BamA/TamA family outer membrane protein [Candidatus Sulfurimonas baltica]
MKQLILFLLLFSSLLYGDFVPIYFQGNKQIKERELYEALNLYKPYMYEFWKKEPTVSPETAALLSETIKNFYRSKGYFHAEITHTKGNKDINITISEQSPILVEDISIISKLKIHSAIPFKKGMLFDADQFDIGKKNIKLLYANKGYCNVEIDSKAWIDMETDRAYLMYDVTPNQLCYFGEVEISSPKSIDPQIISSMLHIKQDRPFSPENVRRSYQSLYANEGISKALIEIDVKNSNIAPVKVLITEIEKPIRFQAGVGASSDEGAMLSLGVKHRNIFGNLKTAAVETRLTEIKQTIKTNFFMPLKNRNSTGAEIGFEKEKFIGFKEDRYFGSIFLKQNETPHIFQEMLLFDHVTTYESEDESLFPQGQLFVTSAKLQWSYDTRDDILNPKKGYFLRPQLTGSIKSQISDASYYKYNISGGYIIPLLPSVLALKANFGSLRLYEGNIPASYRFYAGGMNSNRAYNYRKLGPVNEHGNPIGLHSILEMTAEYRFAISGNFRGVVFNDTTFIGENETPEYKKGYYSLGAGVRYVTPIGPIALDIGVDIENPTKQYAFHFHIGELF